MWPLPCAVFWPLKFFNLFGLNPRNNLIVYGVKLPTSIDLHTPLGGTESIVHLDFASRSVSFSICLSDLVISVMCGLAIH